MMFLAFIWASLITGTVATLTTAPAAEADSEPQFNKTNCPLCHDFLLNYPAELCDADITAVRECIGKDEHCIHITGLQTAIKYPGSGIRSTEGYICVTSRAIAQMSSDTKFVGAEFRTGDAGPKAEPTSTTAPTSPSIYYLSGKYSTNTKPEASDAPITHLPVDIDGANVNVIVTDKEVQKGTQTTLTCSVTVSSELPVQVDVSWWDGETKLSNGNGYSINPVAFDAQASTQGSELTVDSPAADKTYTCKVHYKDNEVASKTVQLNTFMCSSKCKGECTGPGPMGCTECVSGYEFLEGSGCTEICPPGNYINEKERSKCTMCLKNTYNDMKGSKKCRPCPPGTTSETGSISADKCIAVDAEGPEKEKPGAGAKGQADAVFLVTTVWVLFKFNY